MEIVFEVPGEPRGKGRPRFIRSTGLAYTPPETRAYEKKIMEAFRLCSRDYLFPDTAYISVKVTAVYAIPKSATKATRAAIDSGAILPKKKPDIDNVLKVVLDSLNGIAYKDDSQVVDVIGKKYMAATQK